MPLFIVHAATEEGVTPGNRDPHSTWRGGDIGHIIYCREQSYTGGGLCTRRLWHKGYHVAHSADGVVLSVWSIDPLLSVAAGL